MRLRAAGPADEPLLGSLLYEAVVWRQDPGSPSLDELMADPRLAAYVDGFGRPEAVGGAWWRQFSAQLPGYGFVAGDVPELALAVFAGHRGRGIGTALLRKLLREAAARGLRGLSLSVARENSALELYQRLGFTVVDDKTEPLTMLILPQPAKLTA